MKCQYFFRSYIRTLVHLLFSSTVLNLKNINYDYKGVNLIKDGGEQLKDDYKALNPIGQVPTFMDEDGNVIGQSVAIMEYLEEKYPEVQLLPGDLLNRAKVS